MAGRREAVAQKTTNLSLDEGGGIKCRNRYTKGAIKNISGQLVFGISGRAAKILFYFSGRAYFLSGRAAP